MQTQYLYPAVIAAGQSLSAAVDLGDTVVVGIVMPAAWSTAGLTFVVSNDGGTTWNEMYSSAGAEVTFTVAAGQYIAVDPAIWKGVMSVKLRSGTSGSPVAQSAGATIYLVTKTTPF